MPTFKQTPASIRYLKARLNILKRPMVWAVASGLILSVFWVGEYLANPQQYTGGNDLDADTNPPNQNPLGNLPTQNIPASSGELFETLPEISTVPTQTSSAPQFPRSDSSRSPLLQEFLLGRSSTAAPKDKPGRSQSPSFSTPSSSETRRDRPPASRLPSLYSLDSPLLGLPSSSLSSTAASRSSASSSNGSNAINPLQSALDRYSPIGGSSQLTPARSLAQSSAKPRLGNPRLSTEDLVRQDSLGQPDTFPQGLPSPQFAPQLSPLPGTTGYTLPPTLRTPTSSVSPSSSSGNLQPIPGQITPQTAPAVPGQSFRDGQPSYPSARQTTAYPSAQPSLAPSSQPLPSAFSVPRAVPGRSIGGGQMNTFSNP
jgi:hypothetical protein